MTAHWLEGDWPEEDPFNQPVASVDYLANWSNQRDSVALHGY
jgi:hypothetical protein